MVIKLTQTKEVRIKICFVGDGNVGKTSLITRYAYDIFSDMYIKTIGTKVTRKELTLYYPKDDTRIHVDAMIWDIMGQKAFRNLLRESYFQGAKGIIGVCNQTERDSLMNLNEWVESAKKITGEVPTILLANKNDLNEDIQFGQDEIRKTATDLDAGYLLTSAKTGNNVSQAFLILCKEIIKNRFDLV